jgi:hypothetical protein
MAQAKRPRIKISQFIKNEKFRKYSEYLNDSGAVQDDNDKKIYLVNGDETRHPGSYFKVAEFVIIFMELAQKLYLSCSGINLLLHHIIN